MKTYKVAILGATGAVSQEMIKILMERDFPIRGASFWQVQKCRKNTIADKGISLRRKQLRWHGYRFRSCRK